MKLLLKQKMFSWFDSFDIYNEDGSVYCTIKGHMGWGHNFTIHDKNGQEIGRIKEEVLHWLPHFHLYVGEEDFGNIIREFTWLKPKFRMECNGWNVTGNWYEWNYQVTDAEGKTVGTIDKEIWNWTDTYSITVPNEEDALKVIMIVVAIDAVKCEQTAAAVASTH